MGEASNQLISYPAQECITCQQYNICGGGCPLQWFIFKPEDIIRKEVILGGSIAQSFIETACHQYCS